MPLIRVQSVEPLDGFKVRLTFQNGMRKEIDLEPLLHGPIFEPMRNDPSVFRLIKVVGGTIGWDNGADLDPDVLYYDLESARLEDGATAYNGLQSGEEWRSSHPLTLEDRRAFMKLPIEERRRLLERQAERMIKHYESEAETAERAEWQGGDIVEL
jgi:hypothetical protein